MRNWLIVIFVSVVVSVLFVFCSYVDDDSVSLQSTVDENPVQNQVPFDENGFAESDGWDYVQ